MGGKLDSFVIRQVKGLAEHERPFAHLSRVAVKQASLCERLGLRVIRVGLDFDDAVRRVVRFVELGLLFFKKAVFLKLALSLHCPQMDVLLDQVVRLWQLRDHILDGRWLFTLVGFFVMLQPLGRRRLDVLLIVGVSSFHL